MNKLAIAALSQWDEPDMFDDETLYEEVSTIIGLITLHEGNLAPINKNHFALLTRLLEGCVEATISAIDSAKDDIKAELIHTLEALCDASNELKKCV